MKKTLNELNILNGLTKEEENAYYGKSKGFKISNDKKFIESKKFTIKEQNIKLECKYSIYYEYENKEYILKMNVNKKVKYYESKILSNLQIYVSSKNNIEQIIFDTLFD